jgi:hypothetical protein
MKRTQLLITALAAKTLRPANWASLPAFIFAVLKTVETNIPLWQLPRLIFAILRAPLFGLDARTITVRMVVPFQTAGGAQVLAPNWDAINPIIAEMFGR